MKLVKIQGCEYALKQSDDSQNKASPIVRKPPYRLEELEKKNRKLEDIVRQKFIKGEIKGRKGGSENFYCDIEHEY